MLHIYIILLAMVCAVAILGALVTATNKKLLDNVSKTMAKVAKQPAPAPDPGTVGDLTLRVSTLERGFHELEADCKRYLAKGTQRMRRAAKLNGELDEEEEETEAPANQTGRAFEQTELDFPTTQDRVLNPPYDPIEAVQERINSNGRR